MDKVVKRRDRSVDACYDVRGVGEEGENTFITHSAYQRSEILERIEYEDGTVRIKLVGHWKDYDKAKKEVKEFNRKQRENSSSR